MVYNLEQDLRYGERRAELVEDFPAADRLLDIYTPAITAPENGFPVFFFVHGGGFVSGSKAMTSSVENIFKRYLDAGYAVVSINYYLYRKYNARVKAGWNELTEDRIQAAIVASDDATMALEWLADNASQYKIDMSKVAICGGSAGGITVLKTAFDHQPVFPGIKAVINLWGRMMENPISNPNIPVLTLHGDQDDLIPVENGYAVQQRLEEIGSKGSRLIIMEGRGHAQYKHVGETYMSELISFTNSALNL